MAALGIRHSAPVFVEVFPCGEVVCSATLPEDLRAIDRQGPERPVQQQSAFLAPLRIPLPVLSGAYICSQAYSAVASMKVIRDPGNWERTGLYRLAIWDWGRFFPPERPKRCLGDSETASRHAPSALCGLDSEPESPAIRFLFIQAKKIYGAGQWPACSAHRSVPPLTCATCVASLPCRNLP